jgi:glutamyl-tRNA synthetase
MGITHIIRGKEHLTNQKRQEYLYKYFDWEYPEAIHYGRLKIKGASLSKSEILKGVQEGTYNGWDDPRLATFLALRRRGISPESIKNLMKDIGPRTRDITLSWENLYAYNRKKVDSVANRFFFVQYPVKLEIKGSPKKSTIYLPLHPDYPKRGSRSLKINNYQEKTFLLISKKDFFLLRRGNIIRLIGLFNIKIEDSNEKGVRAIIHSDSYGEAKQINAPLLHWVPENQGIPCDVVMPNGSTIKGQVENSIKDVSIDQIVQFERFGFVRIDQINNGIKVLFAHQ